MKKFILVAALSLFSLTTFATNTISHPAPICPNLKDISVTALRGWSHMENYDAKSFDNKTVGTYFRIASPDHKKMYMLSIIFQNNQHFKEGQIKNIFNDLLTNGIPATGTGKSNGSSITQCTEKDYAGVSDHMQGLKLVNDMNPVTYIPRI